MAGVGNLFRSVCQNRLKSIAKFFHVATSCFPLKISVKSKKKRSSRSQMSCTSLQMSVKSKKKVFTSSDVLFSPVSVCEEQKKVFTSLDILFSPENDGEEQKKVFTCSNVLFSPENYVFTPSDVLRKKKIIKGPYYVGQ